MVRENSKLKVTLATLEHGEVKFDNAKMVIAAGDTVRVLTEGGGDWRYTNVKFLAVEAGEQ